MPLKSNVGRSRIQAVPCQVHHSLQPQCPAKARTAKVCVFGVAFVVRVQITPTQVVSRLAPSPQACVFKVSTCLPPRSGQQVAFPFYHHVSPTLPSSGRAYGTPLKANVRQREDTYDSTAKDSHPLGLLHMTPPQEELTRHHFARLREFRRFSGSGSGLLLYFPIDAYLAKHGFLAKGRHDRGWIVSNKGLHVLESREKLEAERRLPHNDLAKRIGLWLEAQGRLAWLNRPFEVSTRNNLHAVRHLDLKPSLAQPNTAVLGSSRYVSRPDVISIRPTTSRLNYEPWIFEVKVSRQDYYVDIKKPHKRLAYALLAERVYYACPKGLIANDEAPPGCGLVVEAKDGTFEVVVEAPRRKIRHSAHINKLLRERPVT